MCPPAATPLPDISHHCSDEELSMSLEKLVCGGPLPMNVMPDVNPYDYKPEYLPVGLWYFIVLQNHRATEHGAWKATGEPRMIFSNDFICGWRTTYQFCDRQSSNMSRADWLMEEYTITQNGMDAKTIRKDANALCRVLRNCQSSTDQDLRLGHGSADILLGTPGNSTDSHDFNRRTRETEAFASNRQVNNIEAAAIVARDNPINQENRPDADREDIRGDFLEMNDLLDIPPSSSSSSSSSSCLTMSSGKSFDSLVQDIENEIIRDTEKKGADHKFSVSSVKPDRIVVGYALSPESSIGRIEGEIPPPAGNKIAHSLPALATTDKTAGANLQNEKNRGNNPTAQSRATIAPSANARPSIGKTTTTARGGSWLVGGLKCLRNYASRPFSSTLNR